MKKAVFSGFLKVIIPTLLICSIIFFFLMGENLEKITEEDMMYSLQLVDYSLDYKGDIKAQIDKLNSLVHNPASRITVIDKSGNVIADTSSLIDYRDNHIDREEIKTAIAKGKGVNIRFSDTLKKNLMYVAEYSEKSGCIIRLAMPYRGLTAYGQTIIPTIAASIIIAFLAAFILAKRLAVTITDPLDEISTELLKIQDEGQIVSFKRYKYDELNSIVRATETLSDRIDSQMRLLKEENNKMESILRNMTDGLILTDNESNVVIINRVAAEILGCGDSQPGRNIIYYTQSLNIAESLNNVISTAQPKYFDIKLNGRIYAAHIIKSSAGAIITLIDVTYEREAEEIRQNFFSDASHELKTPITSIRGYAELLTGDIQYNEEQKKSFLQKIKSEAANMTGLINDILMISRIESGVDEKQDNSSPVKINSIIEDVLEAMEPAIIQNNINVEAQTEDISLNINYNYMYNLIDNLISNAVKYNKKNGSIYISSKMTENGYMLTVRDTGIGIPAEYRDRVFERFFRVDKGRSRKMGGTGLGLAIVKHIVNFYGGNIALKSSVDEGTEIRVNLGNIIE